MTQDSTTTHKVFVYGTLKKGFHNHKLLETSEFIGEDYVKGFIMMNRGYFPAIFAVNDDFNHVYGEVYKVDGATLSALDYLEGVTTNHYQRTMVKLQTHGEVFAYVQPRPYYDVQRVIGGIWRGEKETKTMWLRKEHIDELCPLSIQHRAVARYAQPANDPYPTKWVSPYNKDAIDEFISNNPALEAGGVQEAAV